MNEAANTCLGADVDDLLDVLPEVVVLLLLHRAGSMNSRALERTRRYGPLD